MEGCKKKWKAFPFPWVLCFWSPAEWSLQTQHTRALGTAPVSLLSSPHGLLPQAHLKCSVLGFILSSFTALVQCPVLLQRTAKMQISIVKKGKPKNMWRMWFIAVISELFNLMVLVFPLLTVETSLKMIFTPSILMLKSTPKTLQKLNFSGIKPYSLCSGQGWEQKQSI